MDITMFTEILTNFGLPVALIIAMGAFIWILYKQSVTREEKLMAEITENRLVNEKAIETLALYSERLGTIEGDIKDVKADVMLISEKLNH